MSQETRLCVVVPVYTAHISADEELALRHLEHYLPDVDKYLAMPRGLEFARDGFRPAYLPEAFFAGVDGHNQMMLSRRFYARFRRYEYLLSHQLDAIVIGGDYEPFLHLGVDYLGAPWVDHDADGGPRFDGVGNGGLSLRRVDGFLRLLSSRVHSVTPREHYRRYYAGGSLGRRLYGVCMAGAKGVGVRNTIRSRVKYRRRFGNEDIFIAAEARRYSPGFVVGTVAQALEFAFEREPRFCLEQAGGRLPWGAHAWARYDRAFWEPYLLR